MNASTDPTWFLNSGAYLFIGSSTWRTVFGELSSNDPWRTEYVFENPVDTDNGFHPQNIFRLVSIGTWQNVEQTLYFRIAKTNLSASPNRNESNGVLLFSNYADADNLYYAGIRVDGTAIIKKKINGNYYDLDQETIYPGVYDVNSSPNLMPQNVWIGLRTVTKTLPGGSVSIDVYIDKNGSGSWTQAAHGIDDGSDGGPALSGGHAGIRTDFMDVEFRQYSEQGI